MSKAFEPLTSVQIEVNLARKDGVPADVIRAAVNNRPQDLTPKLADVYRFTGTVVYFVN